MLRTIARENAVDVLETGTRYPCLGVYADVGHGGRNEVGDPVCSTEAGGRRARPGRQFSRFSRILAALPMRSRR